MPVLPQPTQRYLQGLDVDSLFEGGSPDSATQVFGLPGKRMGLDTVSSARAGGLADIDDDIRNHRAWGISVGFERGIFGLRVAHQNRNVAKVIPTLYVGNRLDAKNSTIAANLKLGVAKVYAAYSANRGWGSSPLWNPDNPYGAMMASTPSTNSRDILVGMAVPYGRATTLLASFVRKNDRDLANRDADQFALGATYAVSRKMDFYAAYSHTQFRPGMAGIPVDSTRGSSALNIGMRHAF
ncbi:MAG: porin [Gammaproteobacteria bacterium]